MPFRTAEDTDLPVLPRPARYPSVTGSRASRPVPDFGLVTLHERAGRFAHEQHPLVSIAVVGGIAASNAFRIGDTRSARPYCHGLIQTTPAIGLSVSCLRA